MKSCEEVLYNLLLINANIYYILKSILDIKANENANGIILR